MRRSAAATPPGAIWHRKSMPPLVEVQDLTKVFPAHHSRLLVRAVNGVSFSIQQGETLGLVGESGSGKSTVGRCILRLIEPTSGKVRYRGDDLLRYSRREFRYLRPKLQMVFQDPYGSLNPRMRIGEIIREPLDLWASGSLSAKQERVRELASFVYLEEEHLRRFPHQLSGGQLQRVGIARALATNPEFVALDEPTASLDLSVRADILDLLRRLQAQLQLSYLLISHDLTTVRKMSARVAVTYLGKFVEIGDTDQIFRRPTHPYTRALLSSVPLPDPDMAILGEVLEGEIPSPVSLPVGCHLYSRCSYRLPHCREASPELVEVAPGHSAACFRAEEIFRQRAGPSQATPMDRR